MALVVRDAGVNLLPGLGMLGAGVLLPVPRGVGLAVVGAVVTAVGALLLYQSQSGHWESWAYAWALLPAATGATLFLYGALARDRGMRSTGAWLLTIALVVFVVGAWFFEGLFAGEPRPADLGSWWPIAVIIVGVSLAIWSFVRPRESGTPTSQGHEPRPL